MERRSVLLSDAARAALERTRDRDRRPYLRERAAAVLKVADGRPASLVARHDRHRRRHPDTVYRWLDRYEADGLAGLVQPPRNHRGLSPPEPIRALVHAPAGARRVRHRPQPLAAG